VTAVEARRPPAVRLQRRQTPVMHTRPLHPTATRTTPASCRLRISTPCRSRSTTSHQQRLCLGPQVGPLATAMAILQGLVMQRTLVLHTLVPIATAAAAAAVVVVVVVEATVAMVAMVVVGLE
jgi:hypothetical protein